MCLTISMQLFNNISIDLAVYLNTRVTMCIFSFVYTCRIQHLDFLCVNKINSSFIVNLKLVKIAYKTDTESQFLCLQFLNSIT
jgi:hypothetical protein